MKKIGLLTTLLISGLLLTGCNKTVVENPEIINDTTENKLIRSESWYLYENINPRSLSVFEWSWNYVYQFAFWNNEKIFTNFSFKNNELISNEDLRFDNRNSAMYIDKFWLMISDLWRQIVEDFRIDCRNIWIKDIQNWDEEEVFKLHPWTWELSKDMYDYWIFKYQYENHLNKDILWWNTYGQYYDINSDETYKNCIIEVWAIDDLYKLYNIKFKVGEDFNDWYYVYVKDRDETTHCSEINKLWWIKNRMVLYWQDYSCDISFSEDTNLVSIWDKID